MSNKFNTDKLNIMTFFESLVKALITAFILIFFLTSIIQTASFFQLTIKGSYDVTGTQGEQTSGIVYLTTLNIDPNAEGSSFSEGHWAEISSSNNHTVEEMEEGSYHCEFTFPLNRQCTHKYAWENDDEWESRMAVHKTKITNLSKKGHTDVFEPKAGDSSQDDFYMGFNLNAELESNQGSKFKEYLARHNRGGFGLFLIAVPYDGHYIQKIEIATIGDKSGNFIEFTAPNNSPNCTNTSCQLDFDNDFTHNACRSGDYQQGWINNVRYDTNSPDNGHWCHSLNRKPDAQTKTVTEIPETQRGTIYRGNYMPAYSISENSNFRGKECRGCTHQGNTGDKQDTNLWDKVWYKMNAFQPELTDALKGNATSNVNAHKAQARTMTANGETISTGPKMNSDDTLTDTYLRREQPVVIGLMTDYAGGDARMYDWFAGAEGDYWDVYSVGNYQYQIRVLFAENGYNIDAEIWKPKLKTQANQNGSTTANDHVSNIMSWDQTPKTFNSDVPNLGKADTSTITIGTSRSEDCIYRTTYTQWKTVEGVKTYYNNANPAGTSTHPPTPFDVIGGTAATKFLPLGATVQTGEFKGLNVDFVVQTFPPNFYVKSQDKGAYGEIWQGHVLADDWDLNENNRTIIHQNRFGSSPNEIATCGFINSFQQVHIEPNKDDFYYFHDITSLNADIYVRNIMSGSGSETYEKLTPQNITHIRYALNPFYVYAKIKPQDSAPTDDELLDYANSQTVAEVNITFKKFPTIELKSVIGSNLVARVTPNRVQTTNNRDPSDCTKDLIFSDNFPLYSIEPQSPAASNACASVEFKIHKKLERLYIQMTDQGLITPIQLFSNASNPQQAKAGISPDPGNVSILPLPSNGETVTSTTTALSDQSRSLTLEKLSSPEEYKLTLPAVGQNIEVYIDFVPFSLYYHAALDPADPSGTTIDPIASPLSGFLDGDAIATEIVNGTMVKATKNEEKNTNINITGDGRQTYYISDILEERNPDDGPKETTSRLGDYYAKLKDNLFGALQAPNFFSTRPVVADTNIYFILSKYKNIEVKFEDTNEDRGHAILRMDGLVAPYNNDGVTSIMVTSDGTKNDVNRFNINGEYTQFIPNKIKWMNGSTLTDGYVAFRMWDTPTITIQPKPGYYIKEAKVEAEDSPGTWSQIMERINLPDNPDTVGAKDITIDGVTKNILITIDFEKKPSVKSYGLGDF